MPEKGDKRRGEATSPVPGKAAESENGGKAWPLAERPGFLARRLHQLHVSLFSERCAAFGVTPLQYSLLSILSEAGEADQTTLAQAVALDRTTTTGALKRLEARGLVRRETLARDKRSQHCRVTPEGRVLHAAMEGPVRGAHEATVAALTPAEQALLLALVKKIVVAGETSGPADVRDPDA